MHGIPRVCGFVLRSGSTKVHDTWGRFSSRRIQERKEKDGKGWERMGKVRPSLRPSGGNRTRDFLRRSAAPGHSFSFGAACPLSRWCANKQRLTEDLPRPDGIYLGHVPSSLSGCARSTCGTEPGPVGRFEGLSMCDRCDGQWRWRF
jgi:hypothetical protein